LPPGSLSRPDVQRKPKILALPGMAPPPAPQSPCLNMTVSAQADGAFFAPDTAPQGVVTGEQIQQQAAFDGDEAETTRPELLMKPAARPSKSVRRLSFCHEAGPSGYGLQEALSSMPLRCWLGLPGATLALNRPTEPRWG